MTVLVSDPETGSLNQPEPPEPTPGRASAPRRPRSWWRRPWLIPLVLVVAAFLGYYVWPRYISFDPADSLVPSRFPAHFALLMVHIVGGTIAMVAMCLQLWPWLRRNHPAVHRASGRLYIFAGVVPITLVTLFLIETQGHSNGAAGGAAWSALWLATTLIGYKKMRQGKRVEHRRWMIRSFALGLAIVETRVVFTVATTFPELGWDPILLSQLVAWVPWVSHLLLAELWLALEEKKEAVRL